jgi:cytidine deaminase
MTAEKLVELALRAREHAYVPYSNFRVGAALEAAGIAPHAANASCLEVLAYSPLPSA